MWRWRQAATWFVLTGLVVFVLGAGCSHSSADDTPPPPEPVYHTDFDSTRAWADLLHQVEMGYRVPGTATHVECRDWLQAQLTPLAATVTLQPFSAVLGGKTVSMWNIIATVPGTGAAPREQVLLCAHWDTRPTADRDPDPAKRATPISGANDGASGVAILLEIARQLKAHPIARDVTLVFFDGEDYGPKVDKMLLGSKYYAAHLPADPPDWGILLDMVGDKELTVYREPNSDLYAGWVNDRVFTAARKLGLVTGDAPGFVDRPYKYAIEDDHTALNKADIPTVDLIDFDYPAWHTTADTPAQCSAVSLQIVGKVVLLAIQR